MVRRAIYWRADRTVYHSVSSATPTGRGGAPPRRRPSQHVDVQSHDPASRGDARDNVRRVSEEQAAWREGRRAAAQEHAEALRRRQESESRQARALLADFVERARAGGLAPRPLLARGYRGRRYRTGLEGWYLRRNQTVGVDLRGEFYLLTVPDSLAARLRGVTLAPSEPPLVVGRGGRDGESVDLAELVRLRLEAGTSWD